MTFIKSIIPRLPSRDLEATKQFYVEKLKFAQIGNTYPEYIMLQKDDQELHFFLFRDLDIKENYGMSYIRVKDIDALYESYKETLPELKGPENKPWGQREFYVNDTDNNALAFGQSL